MQKILVPMESSALRSDRSLLQVTETDVIGKVTKLALKHGKEPSILQQQMSNCALGGALCLPGVPEGQAVITDGRRQRLLGHGLRTRLFPDH